MFPVAKKQKTTHYGFYFHKDQGEILFASDQEINKEQAEELKNLRQEVAKYLEPLQAFVSEKVREINDKGIAGNQEAEKSRIVDLEQYTALNDVLHSDKKFFGVAETMFHIDFLVTALRSLTGVSKDVAYKLLLKINATRGEVRLVKPSALDVLKNTQMLFTEKYSENSYKLGLADFKNFPDFAESVQKNVLLMLEKAGATHVFKQS